MAAWIIVLEEGNSDIVLLKNSITSNSDSDTISGSYCSSTFNQPAI